MSHDRLQPGGPDQQASRWQPQWPRAVVSRSSLPIILEFRSSSLGEQYDRQEGLEAEVRRVISTELIYLFRPYYMHRIQLENPFVIPEKDTFPYANQLQGEADDFFNRRLIPPITTGTYRPSVRRYPTWEEQVEDVRRMQESRAERGAEMRARDEEFAGRIAEARTGYAEKIAQIADLLSPDPYPAYDYIKQWVLNNLLQMGLAPSELADRAAGECLTRVQSGQAVDTPSSTYPVVAPEDHPAAPHYVFVQLVYDRFGGSSLRGQLNDFVGPLRGVWHPRQKVEYLLKKGDEFQKLIDSGQIQPSPSMRK